MKIISIIKMIIEMCIKIDRNITIKIETIIIMNRIKKENNI